MAESYSFLLDIKLSQAQQELLSAVLTPWGLAGIALAFIGVLYAGKRAFIGEIVRSEIDPHFPF